MVNDQETVPPPSLVSPFMRVVLVEPEIPQNTGNIGRTCVGLNSSLDLVGPLGFEISHSRLKRAGLDYWTHLTWQSFVDWPTWANQNLSSPSRRQRSFFFSAKADRSFYEISFQRGDQLVFGCETRGLPEPILREFESQSYLIPMPGQVRGYNLATAVAIVLFEAYRQLEYDPAKNV